MLKKINLFFYLFYFLFFSSWSFAGERNDKNLLTFGAGLWDWNDSQTAGLFNFEYRHGTRYGPFKPMIGGLINVLIGGDPILSKTISLRTVESEIAKSITEIQNNNDDVEIGSYPFFRAGKLGVSIVIRSPNKEKNNVCEAEILELVKSKGIEIVEEV